MTKEPPFIGVEGFKGVQKSYGQLIAQMEIRMVNKFAPVAPIHIYEALANRGYVPDNILLLAHDVVKDDNQDRYGNLFQGVWNNTHVIMDNSVIELGGAVDMQMIHEAVNITDADVVVLPDSLTDGPESAELTIRNWDQFKTLFDPMGVELLAVVQGETELGFMTALEMLATQIDPDWISIPRRTEAKFDYSRHELIDFVRIFFPDKPLHLLGFSEYPWADIRAARHPSVRSIDSAAPLRVNYGHVFSGIAEPRVTQAPDGSHQDWWTDSTYDNYMLDNISKVDRLISNGK